MLVMTFNTKMQTCEEGIAFYASVEIDGEKKRVVCMITQGALLALGEGSLYVTLSEIFENHRFTIETFAEEKLNNLSIEVLRENPIPILLDQEDIRRYES